MHRAFDDGSLGVSAISVWEAAMLVKQGRLRPRAPARRARRTLHGLTELDSLW